MAILDNARHEKFIQCVVKGMKQREAYREAYNNNMTDKQVDEEASKLFHSPKVHQRYEELMSATENEAIMSATERKLWLTKLIRDELSEEAVTNKGDIVVKMASLSDKMKALDILNKMGGEYVQKIEAEVDNNVVINIQLEDDVDE